MRGTLAVLIVVSMLFVPTASAQITWFLPETVYAGHPTDVGALFAWPDEDGELGEPEAHSGMTLEALSDGRLFFSTPDIHEHDGFHTFVITPPREGRLMLSADGARPIDYVGDSGKVGPDGKQGDVVWVWAEADDRMEKGFVPDHFGNVTWTYEHRAFQSSGANVHYPVNTRYDVRNAEGNLVLQVASEDDFPRPVSVAPRTTGTELMTYIGPAGGNGSALVGHLGHASAPAGSGTPRPVSVDYPYSLVESCDLGGRRLLIDPPLEGPTDVGWGQDTAIRFALIDHSRGGWYPDRIEHLSYMLLHSGGDIAAPDPGMDWLHSRDPYHTATFTLPQPGRWTVGISSGSGAPCRVDLLILPRQTEEVGSLSTQVADDGRNTTVTLRAQGPDGSYDGTEGIPHYEFDTRVYHRSDQAGDTLVWAGKLHGHDGTASFTLHDPLPGDYLVQVYPSPQDADAPRLVTDHPDGFRTHFTVAGDPVPVATAEPEIMSEPAPGALVTVLAILGALAVARHRHRNR